MINYPSPEKARWRPPRWAVVGTGTVALAAVTAAGAYSTTRHHTASHRPPAACTGLPVSTGNVTLNPAEQKALIAGNNAEITIVRSNLTGQANGHPATPIEIWSEAHSQADWRSDIKRFSGAINSILGILHLGGPEQVTPAEEVVDQSVPVGSILIISSTGDPSCN